MYCALTCLRYSNNEQCKQILGFVFNTHGLSIRNLLHGIVIDLPCPPRFAKVAPVTISIKTAAWRIAMLSVLAILLAGCENNEPTPAEVRAQITRLIPATVKDRENWAADIQYAFAALKVEASPENMCSVLAITEQESTFNANPSVPNLGVIALKEIEDRAARYHIPAFAVHGVLQLKSPNGDIWEKRITAAHTEKELSDLFEEMIASVPMGKRLFARANPVHTGGPMQVSVAFAEAHARQHSYPYETDASIRHQVFTRRGGMYFGIAHLLDYQTSYNKKVFRFADYNAGHYASRNAAFQNAVAVATGIPLDLDGDLIRYKKDKNKNSLSATESAVRSMATKLGMTHEQIHSALLISGEQSFEESELYSRVFAIADKKNGNPLTHATLPRISLHSPKITRVLTTEWFANRVNQRYRKCMARNEAYGFSK
jgi:hypothetical protein